MLGLDTVYGLTMMNKYLAEMQAVTHKYYHYSGESKDYDLRRI